MTINAEPVEKPVKAKRYKIQHPISAYTFPREARIHHIWFDDTYLHVQLTDERLVAIPLRWIPTLYNAVPEEREKYKINSSQTMIIWDPDECAINDEVHIIDYLGPCREKP